MHLLNALAESNEDAQAPAVKRAAAALEIPLSNRVRFTLIFFYCFSVPAYI
jgi:hypothetical protein